MFLKVGDKVRLLTRQELEDKGWRWNEYEGEVEEDEEPYTVEELVDAEGENTISDGALERLGDKATIIDYRRNRDNTIHTFIVLFSDATTYRLAPSCLAKDGIKRNLPEWF